MHQRIAAGEEPNQKHHRAAAWPRSRGDGAIVRRSKELSALSITIRPVAISVAFSVARQNGTARRCAGVLSRVAHRHAERRGTDTAPLLKTAGLTAELIADQSATIGVANQIRLVELVAAALATGFSASISRTISTLGNWFAVLRRRIRHTWYRVEPSRALYQNSE